MELRALTPARVALPRTGITLATGPVLDFQLAHARARDAVHAQLQPASLLAALRSLPTPQPPLLLHSQAAGRRIYLQRPDLGRKLDEPSLLKLREAAASSDPHPDLAPNRANDLAIVLADGLSALAVERHAIPLLQTLLDAMPSVSSSPEQLRLTPICVVEQARVAIGDQIAHALHASLLIVLIGERPGLSSPDSLGAYITWQPRPGITTDAGRNCISNIHAEGLSYPQAAARLLHYIRLARVQQTTGIALKDPEESYPPLQLDRGPLP
jgi:ethanolamine ammonia-lyase small subunit